MSIQLKSIGVVAAAVGVFAVVDQTDKRLNYTPVPAEITELKIDCRLENDDKKLVDKETDEIAYMDCSFAHVAAVKYDYKENDIKKRATITYAFTSPVDNQVYEAEYVDKYFDDGDYALNAQVEVFAHKKTANKSRFR